MTQRRPKYPPKPCAVCGRPWTPRKAGAHCCGLVCSTALSAVKALMRALGPWEPRQRDEWARVGLRTFRAAWKVDRGRLRSDTSG